MWPDHRGRDAHAARKVGRDNRIRARLLHLAHVAHFLAARDDAHVRIELLGGDHDHQVARVVAGDRKDTLGLVDIGCRQMVVVAGIAMQPEHAGEALLVFLETRLFGIDGDEVAVGIHQFGSHVTPDAAEAADDVVALQLAHLLFHAPSPEGVVEVAFEKENGEAGEKEGYRTETDQRDGTGQHAQAEGIERHHLGVTDGRDRDQRHVEGIRPRNAFRRMEESDGRRRNHRQHHGNSDVDAHQNARQLDRATSRQAARHFDFRRQLAAPVFLHDCPPYVQIITAGRRRRTPAENPG